jgi:type IV pilus secretin PilQ/predicted competence protein
MATSTIKLSGATAVLLGLLFAAHAQTGSPAPASSAAPVLPSAPAPATTANTADNSPMLLVQSNASAAATPADATTSTTKSATSTATTPATGEPDTGAVESGGVGVREFQGDDVGQVLRLLARQSKINMVVSEAVAGTVTMRLEDVTALQAIAIIVKAKGLFMDKIDNVYYVKTAQERTAEPTESDSYTFSYARAKDTAALVASQMASKEPPQVDERTNTMFFRETRSNIDNIRKLVAQIDRPTKQVMIEARLVEVTANPKQSYGINWAGTLGSSTSAKTFSYGAPTSSSGTTGGDTTGANFTGNVSPFALGNPNNHNFFGSLGQLTFGQFAILSIPEFSATLRLLNEDADAEFLANPRIVTADNQQAKIEITRNQPVPQLNFNEQTATAVFGGFQDKIFGNTLLVRPAVNKDNFVTLSVKPEISNKVGDSTFTFAGATVASPVIDKRTLDSNVLIKSGDTLAIGGLLQDEQTKARSKVPVLGDIPILGYAFQERLNARTKRNLLVFVTPTILDQCYGTGLEDQIGGLHHSGEEFADPNGWRNNAKGAVRLVPTAQRQLAADYPKPGIPPAPANEDCKPGTVGVQTQRIDFKSSAETRDE